MRPTGRSEATEGVHIKSTQSMSEEGRGCPRFTGTIRAHSARRYWGITVRPPLHGEVDAPRLGAELPLRSGEFGRDDARFGAGDLVSLPI